MTVDEPCGCNGCLQSLERAIWQSHVLIYADICPTLRHERSLQEGQQRRATSLLDVGESNDRIRTSQWKPLAPIAEELIIVSLGGIKFRSTIIASLAAPAVVGFACPCNGRIGRNAMDVHGLTETARPPIARHDSWRAGHTDFTMFAARKNG